MPVRVVALLMALGVWLPAAQHWGFVREIGGNGYDFAVGIAQDQAGNLYVAGSTNSLDLPANVLQTRPGGSSLYRIRGEGRGWEPLFGQRTSYVYALASAAERPGVLYASTGRRMLRSADFGETWVDLEPAHTRYSVDSIAVHPRNSDVVYAAVYGAGIYRSADGGATWEARTPKDGRAFDPNLVAIDPAQPATVYAYYSWWAIPAYRSEDGGRTWRATEHVFRFMSFQYDRGGATYAISEEGLWRSADHGDSWELVRSDSSLDEVAVTGGGTIYILRGGTVLRSQDGGNGWVQVGEAGVFENGLTVDPRSGEVYVSDGERVFRTRDGEDGWTHIGPPATGGVEQIVAAGGAVYVRASVADDVFVAKLDPSGAPLWMTYFGGGGRDYAVGVAVDPAGNVYVAGNTESADFPRTRRSLVPGASFGGSFVFELSPEGRLRYSNLLTDRDSQVNAIAVDPEGSAYVTGSSGGGLVTTAGVVRPDFVGHPGQIGSLAGNNRIAFKDGFVMKLKPEGRGVAYSTYLGELSTEGRAIAVDADGNAYVADRELLWKLNSTASGFRYSTILHGADIAAVALDANRELVVTGSTRELDYYTSPDAFQPRHASPPGPDQWIIPIAPILFGESHTDGFVTRMSAEGGQIVGSTYLGGEADDGVRAVALDGEGNPVVVGRTQSAGFPTRGPVQGARSWRAGFLTKLDGTSSLRYSTYAGDSQLLSPAGVVVARDGSPVVAGSPSSYGYALSASGYFLPYSDSDVVVLKLIGEPDEDLRIDAVHNSASRLAAPLSPFEWITVEGAGFGPDARMLLNGEPADSFSGSGNVLARTPADVDSEREVRVAVESGGERTAPVLMPTAVASPAIFTQDGSGLGSGLIWNEDGSLNSADNPAEAGSVITIACNGVGRAAMEGGAGTVRVFVGSNEAEWVSSELAEIPDLPGAVLLVKARIPGQGESAASGQVEIQIGMDSELGVAVLGVLSPSGMWSRAGVEVSVVQ